jgi:hypothetical protein
MNDESLYMGEWNNNIMEGYGEYVYADGKIYKGLFLNGKKHGFGIYIISNKVQAFIGFWDNGKQHGMGKVINKGSIKYGFWENGKRTKWFLNRIKALNVLDHNQTNFKLYFTDKVEDIAHLIEYNV